MVALVLLYTFNKQSLSLLTGDSLEGSLLRTVCPGETSVIVTGCTGTMHLYLKSTDSITKKGLKFSYRTVPQGETALMVC